METFGDKKIQKNPKNKHCIFCDYITCNKKDYDKHLLTQKHKNNTEVTNGDAKIPKNPHYICDICCKQYNSRNGLWKHKKICEKSNDNLIVDKLTSLIVDVVKQNQEIVKQTQEAVKDVVKQNTELTLKITDVCKYQNNSNNTNISNCNNKTFNLNIFLNETCKDAMNMSDFINSLQIEYDDFERVGEIGFVNGISNIIIKNLKELDITQRPLHCTDKKREVVYVKEDNKWEKEDENYTKTRKLIKKTADKNTRLIPEFKKRYPDCGKSSSKYSDKYDLLIIETMGGSGDNDFEKETKILKNIAKEVFINKAL
jgi:hypothetical protein